jgi:PAS domain S-box-containing protein
LSDGHEAPQSAALVVSDISGRKRVEARARETERRFREVADAAPVFIWTSGTDRRRQHTWVNAHWAQFRGRPLEDELGSGWTTGLHPDDAAACLEMYSSAFDRRRPLTAEYRLKRQDGAYRWLLDTGTPMHDEHGQFLGYVGSSVDITERKTSEGEREALLSAERRARAEAEQANRLKDEFLSILSHELRTPLNAVLGWVHLLRTSIDADSHLDRGLTIIERNAKLQSRMVDDLLDMGGVITGKMRLERRPVALDRVVDGVVESQQPAFIQKGVMLQRGPVEAAEVEGDPSRLQQIVWNLLSNALKFTPAGGEVGVDVSADPSTVRIVVRDNGAGIAPEFLPFVFDRFRQGDPSTRRSHSGLGIGLALVKSLSEMQGGSVRAESAGPGRGSMFTVALPRSPREAVPRAHASAAAGSSTGEQA